MRRVILLLVVIVFAAAMGETATGRTERLPRGVGSPLADGFVILSGTRLIGTSFRAPTRGGLDEWTALLLVERDPVGIYDAYVDQARRLGIALPGSGAARPVDGWMPCNLDLVSQTVPLGTHDPRDARALECAGVAEFIDADTQVVVQLSVRWGGTTHHLYLNVSRSPAAPGYTTPDAGDAHIKKPMHLPPRLSERDQVEVGAPFGAPNDGFYSGYTRARLEAGSHLAAPEAFSVFAQDFVAVLRVDGSVDRVLERYVRQLGGGETALQHGMTPDAERVAYFFTSPFGGGVGQMLADPSGRWILVQTHSD